MKNNHRQTYFCVQALRGIAACMVLVHHCAQTWISKIGGVVHNSGWANGAAGVDIFFVISGFVMVVSTQNNPTAGEFLSRRLIRIVPLYWLLTVVAILDDLAKGNIHHTTELSTPFVLSSLFFLPSRRPDAPPAVVLGVGWTLCFEMFFYLLFSIAIYYKLPKFRSLAAVMIPLAIAGSFYQPSWPGIALFLNPILLEFLGGILIANAVLKGFRPQLALIALTGIAGFTLLLATPDFDILTPSARALFWGVPALMVVAAVVFAEARFTVRVPGFLLALGDASYSLYLLHVFVIQVLIAAFAKIRPPYSLGPVFVAVALLISACCAHLLYQRFEVPVGRRLRQKNRVAVPI